MRLLEPSPQLCVTHESVALSEGAFRRPRNSADAQMKPIGGIWTSALHPATGSDWVSFLARERHDHRRAPGARRYVNLWALMPKAGACILNVASMQDLEEVLQTYSLPGSDLATPACSGALLIDWESMAEDCDGFHVATEALRDCYPMLRSWDCESTVWLGWCFEPPVLLANMLIDDLWRLSERGQLDLQIQPEVGPTIT